MFTKDDSCYTISGRYCSAIEFYLSEHKRRAFCTSQLIEYTLEPNPDAADDKDIPPQRLALVFSTADVEVLGCKIADENIATRVGLTGLAIEDMYQTMAIANYEDRFVIPTAHREVNEDAYDLRGSCGFSFGNGCSGGASEVNLFGTPKRAKTPMEVT